eukprot:scaffold497_cov368-Prasinococcus_capsulatus_cf.AAC.6
MSPHPTPPSGAHVLQASGLGAVARAYIAGGRRGGARLSWRRWRREHDDAPGLVGGCGLGPQHHDGGEAGIARDVLCGLAVGAGAQLVARVLPRAAVPRHAAAEPHVQLHGAQDPHQLRRVSVQRLLVVPSTDRQPAAAAAVPQPAVARAALRGLRHEGGRRRQLRQLLHALPRVRDVLQQPLRAAVPDHLRGALLRHGPLALRGHGASQLPAQAPRHAAALRLPAKVPPLLFCSAVRRRADGCAAMDAARGRYHLVLMQAMLVVPYVGGAVAKINWDWLGRCQPPTTWFAGGPAQHRFAAPLPSSAERCCCECVAAAGAADSPALPAVLAAGLSLLHRVGRLPLRRAHRPRALPQEAQVRSARHPRRAPARRWAARRGASDVLRRGAGGGGVQPDERVHVPHRRLPAAHALLPGALLRRGPAAEGPARRGGVRCVAPAGEAAAPGSDGERQDAEVRRRGGRRGLPAGAHAVAPAPPGAIRRGALVVGGGALRLLAHDAAPQGGAAGLPPQGNRGPARRGAARAVRRLGSARLSPVA